MKGPGVFLAQFLRDEEPFASATSLGKWFAGLGYKGVQVPAWDRRAIDLDKAAGSRAYCEDYRGKLADLNLEITALAGDLQAQVLAVHPAYAAGFSVFHPPGLEGPARTQWAVEELTKCVRASANLGLRNIPTLSGGFAWHLAYPWPQRPPG